MNLPPNSIIACGPVIIEEIKNKKQILLNKHKKSESHPNPKWQFCGGKMEDFDQSLEETAKREVKEEMGINIKIEKLIDIYLDKKEDGGVAILVHYLAKRIGEVKPDEDIEEWNWFPLDKLPENRQPNVDYIINKIKK